MVHALVRKKEKHKRTTRKRKKKPERGGVRKKETETRHKSHTFDPRQNNQPFYPFRFDTRDDPLLQKKRKQYVSPLTRFPSSSPETGGTTETETEKRAARHRHRCRHRHTREDDTNRPATQPTPLPKDFSRPTVPTRPDTDQPSGETTWEVTALASPDSAFILHLMQYVPFLILWQTDDVTMRSGATEALRVAVGGHPVSAAGFILTTLLARSLLRGG